ncbi:MAG TPA: hypothetical protein VLN44_04435 [Pyrinomonadaceae bacterium]|nr:hypothetical protein [Pyrinomonadaceae bacterium]
MSVELTESEFSGHLNSKFQLDLNGQNLELELVEVKGYLRQEHEQGGMERFSVFFRGPVNIFMPQSVYGLRHSEMGRFDIFLVPVSRDQESYRYEAVFNYFKK